MTVDITEFMEGCRKLGGKTKKHSEWDYTCDLDGISVGMNINGLVQVFDRRKNALNDVAILNFDRFEFEKPSMISDEPHNMVFHSPSGSLKIIPLAYGFKIETTVMPGLTRIEKVAGGKPWERYGRAKIKVPERSITRMAAPEVAGKKQLEIEWEPEEGEPVFIADGKNVVKGTPQDFMVSSHAPEFTATETKAIPVVFRIGEEVEFAKRKGPDFYPAYQDPPFCVPIKDSCFDRELLYGIAEEITGKPIKKPYGGIVEEAYNKPVKLKGHFSKSDDYRGILRIVDERKGVHYIVYPSSFLMERESVPRW